MSIYSNQIRHFYVSQNPHGNKEIEFQEKNCLLFSIYNKNKKI